MSTCSPCNKKSAPLVIIALFACLAVIGFVRGDTRVIGAASGTYVGGASVPAKKTVRISRIKLASTAQATAVAQTNTEPLFDLAAALERRGVKVALTESQINGFSMMNVTLDKKKLTPWVMGNALDSVIVFEYYPRDGEIVFEY